LNSGFAGVKEPLVKKTNSGDPVGINTGFEDMQEPWIEQTNSGAKFTLKSF
jgi:hypothetical protein